jgi:hypothetical protein
MDDDTENIGDESVPYLNQKDNSLFSPSNLLFRAGAKSEIKSKLDFDDHRQQKHLR